MDWDKLIANIPNELDKLDEVPASLKYCYERDNDSGKYKFTGSEKLFNSMRSAKEDKTGLTDKMSAMERKLEGYSTLGELDGLKDLVSKRDAIEQAKIDSNADLDRIRTDAQKSIDETKRTYDEREGMYRGAIVDQAKNTMIASLLYNSNVTPEGEKLAQMFLSAHLKANIGDDLKAKFTVVDDSGKARTNDRVEDMSPAELMTEMREQHAYLFKGNGKSGMGSTGSASSDVGVPSSSTPASDWSPAQVVAYRNEHGATAYKALVLRQAKEARETVN